MFDLDKLIEKILGSERALSSDVIPTRTYSDEPILQKGSDFRKRYEEHEKDEHPGQAIEVDLPEGKIPAEPQRMDAETRRAVRAKANARAKAEASANIHERLSRKRMLSGKSARRFKARGNVTAEMPTLWDAFPADGANQDNDVSVFGVVTDRANPYQEARNLANSLRRTGARSNRVFYDQAVFMADWEDSIPYREDFNQSYPSYVSLSTRELPEYISWRTDVRKGCASYAPVGFVLLNAYELICGVGVTPGIEGYEALRSLREKWGDKSPYLKGVLGTWIDDYNIYHDLGQDPLEHPGLGEFDLAIMTLDSAQRACLAQLEGNSTIEPPSDERVFNALLKVGMYHNEKSPFFKSHPEASHAVAAGVFRRLVEHFHKRRKTDLVEGIFGSPSQSQYFPFSVALFYQPAPHPDADVYVSPAESYSCRDGKWTKKRLWRSYKRSEELGNAMRAIDREMREAWDFPTKLKERPTPKYLLKMIRLEIEAWQELEHQREASRIDIDWSKLVDIRATAADICEALLVDEERGDEPSDALPATHDAPAAETGEEPPAADTQAEAPAVNPDRDSQSEPDTAAQTDGEKVLGDAEARLMQALLDGRPANDALLPDDPLPMLLVDSINEKFLDLVGDVVVELVNGEPVLIEDYLDDIKEVL